MSRNKEDERYRKRLSKECMSLQKFFVSEPKVAKIEPVKNSENSTVSDKESEGPIQQNSSTTIESNSIFEQLKLLASKPGMVYLLFVLLKFSFFYKYRTTSAIGRTQKYGANLYAIELPKNL